jgi:hypothetical protein
MDMGVDKGELRPSSKVPNFGKPVANNSSPLTMFGLRPSGYATQILSPESFVSLFLPISYRLLHHKPFSFFQFC